MDTTTSKKIVIVIITCLQLVNSVPDGINITQISSQQNTQKELQPVWRKLHMDRSLNTGPLGVNEFQTAKIGKLFSNSNDAHKTFGKTIKALSFENLLWNLNNRNTLTISPTIWPIPSLYVDVTAKIKDQSIQEDKIANTFRNSIQHSIKRTGRQEMTDESQSCVKGTIEIDLTFRDSVDTDAGALLLECTGKAIVSKCEGLCTSMAIPSVKHYDGFERECACCRDSATSSRSITLNICTLDRVEVHGYSLTKNIVQPTSCLCQDCRS